MSKFRHQPDDPGPQGESFIPPLVFGRKAKRHADSVIRTIRRNAGQMPKERIANDISWSVEHLEKMAAFHNIDLTFPQAKEPEPRGA